MRTLSTSAVTPEKATCYEELGHAHPAVAGQDMMQAQRQVSDPNSGYDVS